MAETTATTDHVPQPEHETEAPNTELAIQADARIDAESTNNPEDITDEEKAVIKRRLLFSFFDALIAYGNFYLEDKENKPDSAVSAPETQETITASIEASRERVVEGITKLGTTGAVDRQIDLQLEKLLRLVSDDSKQLPDKNKLAFLKGLESWLVYIPTLSQRNSSFDFLVNSFANILCDKETENHIEGTKATHNLGAPTQYHQDLVSTFGRVNNIIKTLNSEPLQRISLRLYPELFHTYFNALLALTQIDSSSVSEAPASPYAKGKEIHTFLKLAQKRTALAHSELQNDIVDALAVGTELLKREPATIQYTATHTLLAEQMSRLHVRCLELKTKFPELSKATTLLAEANDKLKRTVAKIETNLEADPAVKEECAELHRFNYAPILSLISGAEGSSEQLLTLLHAAQTKPNLEYSAQPFNLSQPLPIFLIESRKGAENHLITFLKRILEVTATKSSQELLEKIARAAITELSARLNKKYAAEFEILHKKTGPEVLDRNIYKEYVLNKFGPSFKDLPSHWLADSLVAEYEKTCELTLSRLINLSSEQSIDAQELFHTEAQKQRKREFLRKIAKIENTINNYNLGIKKCIELASVFKQALLDPKSNPRATRSIESGRQLATIQENPRSGEDAEIFKFFLNDNITDKTDSAATFYEARDVAKLLGEKVFSLAESMHPQHSQLSPEQRQVLSADVSLSIAALFKATGLRNTLTYYLAHEQNNPTYQQLTQQLDELQVKLVARISGLNSPNGKNQTSDYTTIARDIYSQAGALYKNMSKSRGNQFLTLTTELIKQIEDINFIDEGRALVSEVNSERIVPTKLMREISGNPFTSAIQTIKAIGEYVGVSKVQLMILGLQVKKVGVFSLIHSKMVQHITAMGSTDSIQSRWSAEKELLKSFGEQMRKWWLKEISGQTQESNKEVDLTSTAINASYAVKIGPTNEFSIKEMAQKDELQLFRNIIMGQLKLLSTQNTSENPGVDRPFPKADTYSVVILRSHPDSRQPNVFLAKKILFPSDTLSKVAQSEDYKTFSSELASHTDFNTPYTEEELKDRGWITVTKEKLEQANQEWRNKEPKATAKKKEKYDQKKYEDPTDIFHTHLVATMGANFKHQESKQSSPLLEKILNGLPDPRVFGAGAWTHLGYYINGGEQDPYATCYPNHSIIDGATVEARMPKVIQQAIENSENKTDWKNLLSRKFLFSLTKIPEISADAPHRAHITTVTLEEKMPSEVLYSVDHSKNKQPLKRNFTVVANDLYEFFRKQLPELKPPISAINIQQMITMHALLKEDDLFARSHLLIKTESGELVPALQFFSKKSLELFDQSPASLKENPAKALKGFARLLSELTVNTELKKATAGDRSLVALMSLLGGGDHLLRTITSNSGLLAMKDLVKMFIGGTMISTIAKTRPPETKTPEVLAAEKNKLNIAQLEFTTAGTGTVPGLMGSTPQYNATLGISNDLFDQTVVSIRTDNRAENIAEGEQLAGNIESSTSAVITYLQTIAEIMQDNPLLTRSILGY